MPFIPEYCLVGPMKADAALSLLFSWCVRAAELAWDDVFFTWIANYNARQTWEAAVKRLVGWYQPTGLELPAIVSSPAGSGFRQHTGGAQAKEVVLPGMEKLFSLLMERFLLAADTAAQLERIVVVEGKTLQVKIPQIAEFLEFRTALRKQAAADIGNFPGARAGDVGKLCRQDSHDAGRQYMLRVDEKGWQVPQDFCLPRPSRSPFQVLGRGGPSRCSGEVPAVPHGGSQRDPADQEV